MLDFIMDHPAYGRERTEERPESGGSSVVVIPVSAMSLREDAQIQAKLAWNAEEIVWRGSRQG